MLWLALPREHPSDIKELIMAKIGAEELKKKTGVTKFIDAMNEAFKPTNESRELEIYTEYYVKMKRKEDEKVNDFVNSEWLLTEFEDNELGPTHFLMTSLKSEEFKISTIYFLSFGY